MLPERGIYHHHQIHTISCGSFSMYLEQDRVAEDAVAVQSRAIFMKNKIHHS